MIEIVSKIIPRKPRSVNYISAPSSIASGYTASTTTIVEAVKIVKELEQSVLTDENVLSSLRTMLEIQSRFIKELDSSTYTDDNYLSSLRAVKEINDAVSAALSYVDQNYLNKKHPDTMEGLLTLIDGYKTGDWSQGSSGTSSYKDDQGNWHIETDYLSIRRKLTAVEIEIQRRSHIGGSLMQTAARMTCSSVVEEPDYYRCYFIQSDADGNSVTNDFSVGDQAIMETFNLVQSGGVIGNRFFWRLVVGVGVDYIDLSKSDAAIGSVEPLAGDQIVQLGYRGENDGRKTAIIQAGAGDGSPYHRQYSGIDNYTLPKPKINLSPLGSELEAILHIESGSDGAANLTDLPDEVYKAVQVGSENLLLNTSFTGDYESLKLTPELLLNPTTELYNKILNHWSGVVTVSSDSNSKSGFSAQLGSLSQVVDLISDEKYVISFKAKGESITSQIGNVQHTDVLTNDYQIISHTITFNGDSVFTIFGNATVCDIKLERGTIRTDWCPNVNDPNVVNDKFRALQYLASSIRDGSVDILGGLILANVIELGNYKDGVMQQVTAGLSGIYNSDDDPVMWGGGSLTQAIKAVSLYANDPTYQPTQDELNDMARIVLTHGGRAILNDVILRGYIYALGGNIKNIIGENLTITGNSTFEGEIKGVTGSFKSLNCVNEAGVVVGGIRFGTDGKIWVEGDLYHQGSDTTFYMGDAWVRGEFGHNHMTTMIFYGSLQICYAHLYGYGNDRWTHKYPQAGQPIDCVVIKPYDSYQTPVFICDSDLYKKVTVVNEKDYSIKVFYKY